MLCPVCGGAVYLNFPGVGTLRGLDRLYEWSLVRIWSLVRTPLIVAGEWWRMVEMATG